ncbi:hypothetical protein [Nocardia alni]|uniref:hypothetical protein n=1 Tax=Nocardia alni TaxID=2815723 RepID=UPI001C2197DA|nr:hypothetical protein [Nocardia alni]
MAEQAILAQLRSAAEAADLPSTSMPPNPWPDSAEGTALVAALTSWTERSQKPLVLMFDHFDAIRGESRISVQSQLRAGFTGRRSRFPHSVVLCGQRDVRKYHEEFRGEPTLMESVAPSDITVAAVRLDDFTAEEIYILYSQHTAQTGQEFTSTAMDLAYRYTQGQPWLVNALAFEVIYAMEVQNTIGDHHIQEAKARLIRARATHVDSLSARLAEHRVERVIAPLISGALLDPQFIDDVSYVRDLGLIANDDPIRIANPIYEEIIFRVLGEGIESMIAASLRTSG